MMLETEFPKCKPQWETKKKLHSDDFRLRYKALRNLSSNFISRPDVRNQIFNQKGAACYLCGSVENLQIDHIISVYRGAKEKISYDLINSFGNLMPICARCNSLKGWQGTYVRATKTGD